MTSPAMTSHRPPATSHTSPLTSLVIVVVMVTFMTSLSGVAGSVDCNPGFFYSSMYDLCLRCMQGTYKTSKGPGPCTYCDHDANGHNATTIGDGATSKDRCYFRPYLREFGPKYGPKAGGTLVNITIAYLNVDHNRTRIRIANVITNNCTRDGSSFLCYTGPTPTFDTGPVTVELMDERSEYVAHSTDMFTYKPNPVITSIDNLNTFLSGGKVLTVHGRDLNSVAQPVMVVTRIYKNKTRYFDSDCTGLSNILMTCPTPNLRDGLTEFNQKPALLSQRHKRHILTSLWASHVIKKRSNMADPSPRPINSEDLQFYVGFQLDGAYNQSAFQQLPVFDDPVYHRFDDHMHVREWFPSKHTFLHIFGDRLDYSSSINDVLVSVGDGYCSPVTLTSNELTCQPSSHKPSNSDHPYGPHRSHPVLVTVGNLVFHVGYLLYIDEEDRERKLILGISITGILLAWVLTLWSVCIWCQRRKQQRRKARELKARAEAPAEVQKLSISVESRSSSIRSSNQDDYIYATASDSANGSANGSSNNSDDTAITSIPSLAEEGEEVTMAIEGSESSQMMHIDVWSALEEPLKSKVQEYQIEASKLTLGECIGVGSFGRVFKGEMEAEDGSKISVAVKTLRGKYWCVRMTSDEDIALSGHKPFLQLLQIPSAALCGQSDPRSRVVTKYGFTSAAELPQFLEEAMVMAGFSHDHILPLWGVVVSDCLPFVVSEFMDQGDLRTFIKGTNKETASVVEILEYVRQVADGMVYLSEKGFVHRDLAARNCLINSRKQVKIGDFGLSRDLHGTDYYRVGDIGRPLPVKWMSIESLNLGKFSSKSDVWSFGVLMWEMFTRGRTPYNTVRNVDLKDYINNDNRLSHPPECPHKLYNVMLECWRNEPADRPDFIDLFNHINDVKNDVMHQDALDDVIVVPDSDDQSASVMLVE